MENIIVGYEMASIKEIENIFAGRTPGAIGRHRNFSVLVPFVEKDGEVCIALEVRAAHMESDPGEICFPGGHIEPGEEPKDAAIRETYEEIGIPVEKIRYICQGNTLHGYANYTLNTFLAEIRYEDYLKCRLAENEVQEVFLVPLKTLKETPVSKYKFNIRPDFEKDYFPMEKVGIDKDYKWRTGEWIIPVFDRIEGRCIWGLTARVIVDILEILEEEAII